MPPSLSLPPIIGHRGAAALAPENTLASFRAAAALGCRMVEFDVRLSADGIPVVFHDATLDRTSDGHGRVGSRPLADLKRLDAGGWFSPSFLDERIPTLAETLALCLELGLAVNIEIKPDAGAERATAGAALAVATTMWPSELPPPLVSSFSCRALAAAALAAPDWPRGLLLGKRLGDWRDAAARLGVRAIHAAHQAFDAATIADIRQAGLEVLAYTVNDPGRAALLWRWGVAAVFSDNPAVLAPPTR